MTMSREWQICFQHLEDPAVSEVEANGPNLFFIKKAGKRIKLDIALHSDELYLEGIESSLIPQIQDVVPYERNSYLFEGPLYYKATNGETIRGRCHIVLPPATDSPQITIAKKSTSLATLDAIAGRGSMSVEMLHFLKAAIQANLTITFSGGTGAGKALHKDTKIPTPFGMVTVEDVKIGDYLFDENGSKTKVLRKYCPQDPESFEILFKNGERVKTSAGHLWAVNRHSKLGEVQQTVVTTKEMSLSLSSSLYTYTIDSLSSPVTVNDVRKDNVNSVHAIQSIEQIEDNPEDYYCFEVDSPSHLFLCTESFIPTHNTTMLEACSKLIPDGVRIGVAEDTPELALTQPNVTYLHSVPWKPGMDPNKVATLSWVVQQFQRMRTDRLIIGETRGKEFADFLVAANSGMEGSMTTIHSNSPTRCLDKMTNFALKGAEGQPIRAINTDIGNAIDLIVQLIILPDGRHKVDAIQEVTSTISNSEDARITTAPLYSYDVRSDRFKKESFVTDQLRSRFAEKGINIQQFLNTAPGEMQSPHTEGEVRQTFTRPSSGLPTGIPRREV